MSTTALGNALISVLALMDFKLYWQDFALAGIIFLVLIVFTLIARNFEYSKPADSLIN